MGSIPVAYCINEKCGYKKNIENGKENKLYY